MFTRQSTLEDDQRIFAYIFLWRLHEEMGRRSIEKERLSRAFGFAVLFAHVNKIDLEFCITNGTDAFPAFESIIDEALERGLLNNVIGQNSFTFSEIADEAFKEMYPASTRQDLREITSEAAKIAVLAYINNADAIGAAKSMVLPKRRIF
jgi:hypothetical protein